MKHGVVTFHDAIGITGEVIGVVTHFQQEYSREDSIFGVHVEMSPNELAQLVEGSLYSLEIPFGLGDVVIQVFRQNLM